MLGVKEVLFLNFLKLVDTYTTLILLSKGHAELNPLLRQVIMVKPEFMFVLNAYVFLASLLPMLVERTLQKTLNKKHLTKCEKVIDYGFCCMILVIGLVVMNNLFIVIYNYSPAALLPRST
jgi:hypothetical protein